MDSLPLRALAGALSAAVFPRVLLALLARVPVGTPLLALRTCPYSSCSNQGLLVTKCGDLGTDPDFLRRTVAQLYGDGGEGGTWVLKGSTVNNAQQVHMFDSLQTAEAAVARAAAASVADDQPHRPAASQGTNRPVTSCRPVTSWVLQQYIERPLLVRGRKFHIRVNVLAVGCLAVYVHQDMVFHCATEPFDMR